MPAAVYYSHVAPVGVVLPFHQYHTLSILVEAGRAPSLTFQMLQVERNRRQHGVIEGIVSVA